MLHKYDDEPPDEFENEREDSFEDCREREDRAWCGESDRKSDLKSRLKSKARKIKSKREFAIDQQSAKQTDAFGGEGESPEQILSDVLMKHDSELLSGTSEPQALEFDTAFGYLSNPDQFFGRDDNDDVPF